MLLLALIPFLLIELYLSLAVGEAIGFLWSVIWIVATIMAGVQLLRLSPFAVMGNLHAVKSGKLSMQGFQSASTSYMIGAILLIIPGVFSDLLGVLTLLYTLYLHFVVKMTPEQKHYNQKQGEDDVIDVEVIDEHSDSCKRR
ncbi:MAG TPA: FxsA family protein [Epsilonproteobacteria bacterium]|nr:FxsA family protein [Campylobacterota bacterium]